VVCRLSSVCHICSPCFNRLTDLDAIWRVHFRGPMAHCVRWGLCPRGMENLRVECRAKKYNANFSHTVSPMLPSGEYKQRAKCTCHMCSDSALCQTNLAALWVKQETRVDAHETRDSISLISYAGCLALSAVISAKCTLCTCVTA